MSGSNSKIHKMRTTIGNLPRASSVSSGDPKRSQNGNLVPIPIISGAQPDENLSMLGGSFLDLQSSPNEVWCRRDTMFNSLTSSRYQNMSMRHPYVNNLDKLCLFYRNYVKF